MIIYTSQPHRDLATSQSYSAFSDTPGEAGSGRAAYKLTQNDDGSWTMEHTELRRDSQTGEDYNYTTRVTLYDVIEKREFEAVKKPKKAVKADKAPIAEAAS